jgi:peptidoglycan/xylan/chitin deacetylase (PgdA/CDA1 family)
MRKIRIVVTMDCEPTTATCDKSASGPGDWALGERAVRGYWEIAQAQGFPVTYFVHPETAVAQAAMFNELAGQGACLGLHMHPWKYSLWKHAGKRFMAHYGGLPEGEQRELLREACRIWQDAIGHSPQYFRPGTFSANDAIFKVLAECGFRGGSCSAPGRVLPEFRAIWTGTEPDPHRANAEFRQANGNLDFAEMPLSADLSALLQGRVGRRMHADLRPDTDWEAQYGVSYRTIAGNIVAQVVARNAAVPVINLMTHNHYDYRDGNAAATQRLHVIFEELKSACAAAAVQPVGATLADVAEAVLALPPAKEAFVSEGTVFEIAGEVATLKTAAS